MFANTHSMSVKYHCLTPPVQQDVALAYRGRVCVTAVCVWYMQNGACRTTPPSFHLAPAMDCRCVGLLLLFPVHIRFFRLENMTTFLVAVFDVHNNIYIRRIRSQTRTNIGGCFSV